MSGACAAARSKVQGRDTPSQAPDPVALPLRRVFPRDRANSAVHRMVAYAALFCALCVLGSILVGTASSGVLAGVAACATGATWVGWRHHRAAADLERQLLHTQAHLQVARERVAQFEAQAHSASTHEVGRLLAVGAVHDLRNSLSVVRLLAEELHESQLADPEVSDLLLVTAERGSELCERVLRSYRGHDHHPVDISLRDVVAQLAPAISKVVGLQVPPQLALTDVRVRVDPIDLQQALQNLFENARNAAGASVRLTITNTETTDGAVLTVYDDGPGIPTAVCLGQRQRTGTHGLGLQLVHALLRRNQGTLSLRNHEGGGIVSLTLPRASSYPTGPTRSHVHAAPPPPSHSRCCCHGERRDGSSHPPADLEERIDRATQRRSCSPPTSWTVGRGYSGCSSGLGCE